MLNSLLNARLPSALIQHPQASASYPVVFIVLIQTVMLLLAALIDNVLITLLDTPLLSFTVCVGYFCLICYPANSWRLIALPFIIIHFLSNQHLLSDDLHSVLFSLFSLILVMVCAYSSQRLLQNKETFSLAFIHTIIGVGVLLSVVYQFGYIALYLEGLDFNELVNQWSLFFMGQMVGYGICFSLLMMMFMLRNQHIYSMQPLTGESYLSLGVMTVLTGVTLVFGGDLVHYLSIYLVIPTVWFCYRYRWWGMTSLTLLISIFAIVFVIAHDRLFNLTIDFTNQELIWFLIALNIFSLYLNAMVFELDEINRVNQKNQIVMKGRNKELVEANVQIQELNRHLLSAQERQRQKLSKQLEKLMSKNISALQQSITLLDLEASCSKNENNPFTNIKKFSNIIYLSVHELVNWLQPETLGRLGLINTLKSKLFYDALAVNDIRYEFELKGEAYEIPNETALPLFRVIQEAVNNAIKHSQATEFKVTCELNDSQIQMRIKDNGKGFDIDNVQRGFGLSSMKNRIEAINGSFSIGIDNGVFIHINTPI